MLSSNGYLNPPLAKKLVWGVMIAAFAAILLISGGLLALQQMTINAALPFTFIVILICYSLHKALQEEEKRPY
jgi:glycine betaine transporter